MNSTPETARHDYQPGTDTDQMHTDPLCVVCGDSKTARAHR